jgi:hypothetical protein
MLFYDLVNINKYILKKNFKTTQITLFNHLFNGKIIMAYFSFATTNKIKTSYQR